MIPVSLLGSPGAIGWDSLPLIKIDCFPFGKGHDHPFSQARILALEERELRVRLWSFEVSGSRESHLTFLLHHGEQALACVLFPGQRPSLWSCGPRGGDPVLRWLGQACGGRTCRGNFGEARSLCPRSFWADCFLDLPFPRDRGSWEAFGRAEEGIRNSSAVPVGNRESRWRFPRF